MANDAQSLLSQAQCYLCFGVTLAQGLRLVLLSKISLAKNPANKVDPASLLTQGQCFPCFTNADVGATMELALLTQIAS